MEAVNSKGASSNPVEGKQKQQISAQKSKSTTIQFNFQTIYNLYIQSSEKVTTILCLYHTRSRRIRACIKYFYIEV
jgi:hypothetical protein